MSYLIIQWADFPVTAHNLFFPTFEETTTLPETVLHHHNFVQLRKMFINFPNFVPMFEEVDPQEIITI